MPIAGCWISRAGASHRQSPIANRQWVGFIRFDAGQRELEFHGRLAFEADALAQIDQRRDGIEESARAGGQAANSARAPTSLLSAASSARGKGRDGGEVLGRANASSPRNSYSNPSAGAARFSDRLIAARQAETAADARRARSPPQ